MTTKNEIIAAITSYYSYYQNVRVYADDGDDCLIVTRVTVQLDGVGPRSNVPASQLRTALDQAGIEWDDDFDGMESLGTLVF